MKFRQRRRAAFNAGGGTRFDRANQATPPAFTKKTGRRHIRHRTQRQRLERDLLASLGIALSDLPRATLTILDNVIKVELRPRGKDRPADTLVCEVAKLAKYQRALVDRLRNLP